MKCFFLGLLVCLVCLVPALAQTPEMQAKLQTVLYVKKLQIPDGSFRTEMPAADNKGKIAPSLCATSTAIQALKYLGGELPNKEAVVKFVTSCFDKQSGGFADTPGGQPEVATTAVALISANELGLPAAPYHAAAVAYLGENVKSFDEIRIAVAGLERIKAKSPKAKEWEEVTLKLKLKPPAEEVEGKSRMIASQAVTLLRLGVTLKNPGDVLNYLKAGQRKDGAYCKEESAQSDLETTYRVMRLFFMLKAKPLNVTGLRDFIEKCRGADHGYGVMPGQPSSVSGTYYAAIISHWLDELK